MANQYDLKELPESVVLRSDQNSMDESVVKWSGVYPIPQIGQSVKINFNELGSGKVESYFVEHQYLGLTVRLDKEPAWKLVQHKGTKHAGIAMVFGIEIS